jgi:hypothetical protein
MREEISMPADQIIFAGVELSSGRKPVTFAALDEDLNIQILEKWDVTEALACLNEYETSSLAIHTPSLKRDQEIYKDFKRRIGQVGFRSFSDENSEKQWLETNAQDCFGALIGQKLLPRRTLEGRLQRCALLYERGLQIKDPMDIFEEITRYKLAQGILPLESIY